MIKRIILFVSLLCGVSASSFASGDGDPIEIVITDNDSKPSVPTHRTSSRIPLGCYYDPNMNCVLISFKTTMDEVTIDLYNIMIGESVNTSVPAKGSQIIPCPWEDGYCTITFTFPNGKQYSGWFLL